ncbi:transcriptional regulator [Methylobacterium sp. 37f]|nr:transcriptional regulator [Methylobacterium sp. 37f]
MLDAPGLDADAVRARLRAAVSEAGSLRAWSARNGVAPSVVSEVLQGRREPARTVLSALGLRRAAYNYVADPDLRGVRA